MILSPQAGHPDAPTPIETIATVAGTGRPGDGRIGAVRVTGSVWVRGGEEVT